MIDLLPCYWCEQPPRVLEFWRRAKIACCDFITQPHPTLKLAAAEWNAHQARAQRTRDEAFGKLPDNWSDDARAPAHWVSSEERKARRDQA